MNTPNHPEYPAAHSCQTTSSAEIVRNFFGTKNVSFELDSTVTGTTRRYTSTEDWIEEIKTARIAGGMHYHLDGTRHGARPERRRVGDRAPLPAALSPPVRLSPYGSGPVAGAAAGP